MTGAAPVVVRPRRLAQVCWAVAAVVVVAFGAVTIALGNAPEGDVQFRTADQVAFFLLGLLLAGAVMLFARARVVADSDGVTVRNPVGLKHVPWGVVRGVRLDRDASWAVLDLHDDETVQLLAVQTSDGDRAVEAVLALRALLEASRAPRDDA